MPAADQLITFPAKRAAMIAGVTTGRLRYWEFQHVVRPEVRRRLSLRNTVRLYDFDETVSLLIVAELRQRGVSLQQVRKIVRHLHSRGYAEPLTELVFATAGAQVYFQHPDGSWEGGARPDQLVLREVLKLDLIRERVRAGAGRQQADFGQTEQRPRTMGHKVVFTGTRIPVETVVRWLAAGRTPERILEAFPDLTLADIEAARQRAVSA